MTGEELKNDILEYIRQEKLRAAGLYDGALDELDENGHDPEWAYDDIRMYQLGILAGLKMVERAIHAED